VKGGGLHGQGKRDGRLEGWEKRDRCDAM